MQETDTQCVMIIAGEASGDVHGARLVKAMKARNPNLYFCGIGGQAMEKEGLRIVVDAKELSVVGITEILERAGTLLHGVMFAREVVRQIKPDLLILIDFPDFNMMVAKTARSLGVKVLYYISPQIWAWRQNRVKKIKKLVDHIAVILPFEKEFYDAHNVPVTYVGHPLLDHEGADREPTVKRNPNLIGLLPGSRNREVSSLLPVMLQAAAIMREQRPGLQFVLPMAPTVDPSLVESILARIMGEDASWVEIRQGRAREVMEQSQLVIAASGTVTLEAALALAPTVIVYRISSISYLVAKAVIKVKYVGLANLIGKKEIMPELIQDKANPENIAARSLEIILDPRRLSEIYRDLKEVRKLLGGPGASDKTASIALELLGEKSS
ncbi:lipid-A-disaccharide synthase [Desulfatibacillum aliphaticivorans]|uniref:lipid-A-disaccharide synthase n=1 Tax=Desulfatibacillum aliphaticivorans TaxID=218208 RepID=UPI0012F83CB8|nr:lipid-A-disaccharide synthase [Desulfatibacillum aliphaticivorans]